MTTSEGGENNQNSQGEGGEGAGSQATENQNTTTENQPKSFTQEQVNRFNTTAKQEGRKAALQEVADKFGMSIEDADKALKELQAKRDAEKSELEKLRDQNESLQKESEANTTKLQREHHIDKVKLQLSRAGFVLPDDEEAADKALDRLVGLVSVEVGASVEDIKANIAELKEQFPNLLPQTETKEEKPKGNVSSEVSGKPRNAASSGGKSPVERARERAAKDNARRGVTTTA